MGEAENIEVVVKALRTVKPASLKLVEMANSIPVVDGALDIRILQEKQVEINLAVEEAKIYGAHTLKAVDCLVRLVKGGA